MEPSPDSGLQKAGDILGRAAVAPATPESTTQSTASVNSEGSPGEGCCSDSPAMIRWGKNVEDSPVWTQQSEPNQTSYVLDVTANPAGEHVNNLNQLDG